MKRRNFLGLLGLGAGSAVALDWQKVWANPGTASALRQAITAKFQPIPFAIPLDFEGASIAEQIASHRTFTVQDNLVLPEGFTYDLLAVWGDRLGNGHVGYNNDYLGFVATDRDRGDLVVNFEYVCAKPWLEAYETVMGRSLPIEPVTRALAQAGGQGLDWGQLAPADPLREALRQIATAALEDLGIGVISIQRDRTGRWRRQPSRRERRVTGLSGLTDGHYLQATGPATAIFRKATMRGYNDQLGDRIIGTFANCAGGTSPWGTVFSAEENFQDVVVEPVHADGSSFAPETLRFKMDTDDFMGCGSLLGLAGNKYGWMVEIDPKNPQDYGTKHTWLGRFRHEAVALRVVPDRPLAIYSGCDRRGGHIYKFVSQGRVRNPQDKRNSQLLQEGMLYAAQFDPDGTGRWIPLAPDTPVDPVLPSHCVGGMVTLPQRPAGGITWVRDDAVALAFKAKFATLGDLYEGTPAERQGAILIDAHFAANAAGATCTARPEDTELAADGSVLIAFTSGSTNSLDGGPDRRVFVGPQGEGAYEYGWVARLVEADQDPAALTFRWQLIATGGEPAAGGLGFANPDNLAFDPGGDLWMVTDMSGDKQNRPVPADRRDSQGQPLSQSNLRAIYGNNSLWWLPTRGPAAGLAIPFAYGPMETELTGPCFLPDRATLLISVQHPGEFGGTRRQDATQVVELAVMATDGTPFMQRRTVPIGSNWPEGHRNRPPRPGIVAIRREDLQPFC